MFESALLNLQQKSKKRWKKSLKQFCFIYVWLSWRQILQVVFLVKKINLDNINTKPHIALQAKHNQF